MTRDAGDRACGASRGDAALERQVLPVRGRGLRARRPARSRPTSSPTRTRSASPPTASAARSSTSPTRPSSRPAGTRWPSRRSPRPRTSCSTSCTCATSAPTDASVPERAARAPSRRSPCAGRTACSTSAGLARAGLTHVHLLPVFDIATVDEDRSRLAGAGRRPRRACRPTPTEQQAASPRSRDVDGFNWGYDPWHYTVPEGSYATDPDGPTRILEFREMVAGARQDAGCGWSWTWSTTTPPPPARTTSSVLDRIVPGYYHRLNADGDVETSTCCQNTATEHAMMEKLMVDSVVTGPRTTRWTASASTSWATT